jgi:hypothetical protein
MIVAVCAVSMIPLTALAWTNYEYLDCGQQDLEGSWTVRVACPPGEMGDNCWEECSLTIAYDGTIDAGGTYFNCLGDTLDITGGELIISGECVVQGHIDTSNGTVSIFTGAIVGDELVLGKTQG